MEKRLLQKISKSPLFTGIPKNEISVLLDSINYSEIEKKKGEIIANAGEKCINAYILLKGKMAGKLFSPTGQCVRIRHHEEGNLLAPAFLYAKERRYPVTVEAISDVTLVCISKNEFDKMISSDIQLMKNLIAILSNNLLFYSKRVRLLSFSLKERLSEYLYEQKKKQNTNNITLPVSRQQLAEVLGVQKNSIQRCLVELKKDGVIDFEKRNVTILKVPENQ